MVRTKQPTTGSIDTPQGAFNPVLRVLVACERSGRVRDAFRLFGHDAWSCDLVASDAMGPHIQGDAIDAVRRGPWDIIIAHPPCTYLSRVNVAYRRRNPDLQAAPERFAAELWHVDCSRVCVENPIGSLWTSIGKPAQVIHPWWFGDPYTKATCLWLRGLPRLSSMKGPDAAQSYPQVAVLRHRDDGSNLVDSHQSYPQSAAQRPEKGKRVRHRGVDDWWRWPTPAGVRSWTAVAHSATKRSETFAGIAWAMAEQWGGQATYPYQPADRPLADRRQGV